MSDEMEQYGFGWLADYPDLRDYTLDHGSIGPVLKKLKAVEPSKGARAPAAVDLRPWCSPIEDQKSIGSCTAHAGVGLLEYFERRAYGRHVDASRLFLYKATRNLLRWTGDTGAYLRTTMGALALFGAPPEQYWPYVVADYDKEPPAFCYSFGEHFSATRYYRLDPAGTAPETLLTRIKTNLVAGLPSMFGFTVYSSISQAASNGKIPFPGSGERVLGGHAVDAVGYDDGMVIKNANMGGPQTKGAFLIRNSWGNGWGSGGYGYLPYEYVLKGLAVDWWSLIKADWINLTRF
ncbi:MAG: cysteine protease [Deltaproteobacteria bacterium]|nr:MAG: cysteine protease [Deltaproteobacteria bacterium]